MSLFRHLFRRWSKGNSSEEEVAPNVTVVLIICPTKNIFRRWTMSFTMEELESFISVSNLKTSLDLAMIMTNLTMRFEEKQNCFSSTSNATEEIQQV